MRRLAVLTVTGLAAVLSCSKTAEPERLTESPSSPTTTSPPATAISARSAAVTSASPSPATGGLVWTPPSGWIPATNPSPMRKATYKIPRATGDAEDGDLSVSQAGGGVEPNIKRWSGQFEGAPQLKVTHRDVGALKVTMVEGRGTFTGAGMMTGGPSSAKKGWALLGAIVDSVDPPYFFKLTGPEKTITAAHPDFDAFVASLHAR